MILGQSAATGAAMALDGDVAVQEVPYNRLRERLLKDGQVLEYDTPKIDVTKVRKTSYINPQQLPGIVLDDEAATLTGEWKVSSATPGFVGHGYRHNGAARNGRATARFETRLPRDGRYEVLISWTARSNRSSVVSAEVISKEKSKVVKLDQTEVPAKEGQFRSLGVYSFSKDRKAAVVVSNAQSDGYVIIDAVQWLPK